MFYLYKRVHCELNTFSNSAIGLVVSGLVAQWSGSRPSQSLTSGLAPLKSNNCINDSAPT